jgi:hypothetical protein
MRVSHFHDLAGEALNAFWRVVLRRYPHSVTGDLSPQAATTLRLAAEAAVREWVANNVPPQSNQ